MGGKSGKVAAEKPMDFITNTGVGTDMGTAKTFDETTDKRGSIDKKKMGTRGLQIPLASDVSTTLDVPTASTTGVQI